MSTSTSRPNFIFWMLVCLLLLLVGSSANLQAQDKPAQLTEKLSPQQVMELNEMAALQAKMGGGVSEKLKGVVEGSDPEQQFLESLKTLVREKEAPVAELPPFQKQMTQPAPMAGEAGATTAGATTTGAPAGAVIATPTGARSDDPEIAQRVLRSSARMLEELAAELEQAQLYDKADELRRTASNYWFQARGLD